MSSRLPPHFVLVSHSSATARPSATALSHPEIQYHYADDSPLALLPRHADDHVLLLHYPPHSTHTPHVQSLSPVIAVTGLKVEEAPGVSPSQQPISDRMFIIQTRSDDNQPTFSQDKSPRRILAEFTHRNAILRNVLQYSTYPESPATNDQQSSASTQ